MVRFRIGVAVVVLALALSFGLANTLGGGPDPSPSSDGMVLTAALQPFGECDELLDYFIDGALEVVGPYGLNGSGPVMFEAMQGNAAGAEGGGDTAAVAGEAARAEGSAAQDRAFSQTNVQEQGVDEPDIVKTDGQRIFTVAQGRLQIVDVTAARPRQVGTLPLPNGWGAELLLDGERLLILSHGGDAVPMPEIASDAVRGIVPPMPTAVSTLTLVDISDPATPAVDATLTLDGDYVSARLVAGVARVVLRSGPIGLEFSPPEGGGLRAEREATERNREVIRNSTLDNWLPYYVLSDGSGGQGTTSEGRLLDCERVSHPQQFSGLGLLSVLSVDLDGAFTPAGGTGVVASGETVYASSDNLYVAVNDWQDRVQPLASDTSVIASPTDVTTEIHRFDISDPATAVYQASGEVQGRLLNQWALSEHDGHLRVATTRDGRTDADGRPRNSDSVVVVLDRNLAEVGRVGGLGETEQIYAVRYAGDIGYVVTFRQTDPLYTLDLSDPTAPAVRGELKINGYSAYLHPVGDGLLLGVGQDADDQGVTRGTQLSLFDVSDLSAPRRLHQVTLRNAYSPVEYDHRAFLYWSPTDTVVVPIEQHAEKQLFSGAVGWSVGREGFTQLGRVQHVRAGGEDWAPAFSRSLVVDRTVYLLSEMGLQAADLQTLDEVAWVPFAG